MSDRAIAVFGSCNEAYAPYLVTSLRSFMSWDHDRRLDYFVLGRRFSWRTSGLLAAAGIAHVPCDLSRVFPRRRRRPYPSECFWIFNGPSLFAERGYEFSLAVDGDVWCNRSLDLSWLPRVEHLGGIDRGSNVREFLERIGQYEPLSRCFAIGAEGAERRATNTGVLFFRNHALTAAGFFELVADAFRRSEAGGVPRHGDDSTLALAMGIHPEIRLEVLDETWNAYRGLHRAFQRSDRRYHTHLSAWLTGARIVHLSYTKPWRRLARHPNAVTEHFVRSWQLLHRQTRDLQGRGRARPSARSAPRRTVQHSRRARPDRRFGVCCYWYRGSQPNFGDELAPFLVKKIARLPDSFRIPDPPRHPRERRESVLLSVGSVMRLSHPNTVCWGSGIRNIDQPVTRSAKFCAVRGPLTRGRLIELGYECPAIYGDPGLLLPRFYRPRVATRHRLGVIAHVADRQVLAARFAHESGVLVIDLATADVQSVVDQILACEATVSSALHGLVTSVAYGIPTRWIQVSDRIMGDGTKFFDFFASLEPALTRYVDRRQARIGGPLRLRATGASYEAYQPLRWSPQLSARALAEQTNRLPSFDRLDTLLAACPIGPDGWKDDLWRRPDSRSQAR